ncbi:CsbD family protein [Kitasatospora sp. NPDC056327]|uniref:CsbD family protein n=1 Tax=Kitasatospora sp. NPDC056327 TaxID=3345785 RepID=UPI0035DE50AE
MGMGDKIGNAAEKAKGAVKEAAGKATGNERLEAEGRADKAKSDVKQAGEHVKDAFRH